MDTEKKTKSSQQVSSVAQSSQATSPSSSALDKLKEFGGFAFIENTIDGMSNLNPNRKARRNIFLTDEPVGRGTKITFQSFESMDRTPQIWRVCRENERRGKATGFAS